MTYSTNLEIKTVVKNFYDVDMIINRSFSLSVFVEKCVHDIYICGTPDLLLAPCWGCMWAACVLHVNCMWALQLLLTQRPKWKASVFLIRTYATRVCLGCKVENWPNQESMSYRAQLQRRWTTNYSESKKQCVHDRTMMIGWLNWFDCLYLPKSYMDDSCCVKGYINLAISVF